MDEDEDYIDEIPDYKIKGAYHWRWRVHVLIRIRDIMLRYGYDFRRAWYCATREGGGRHGPSITQVRRWLWDHGVRIWGKPGLHWDELNRYLNPCAQRWTTSTAVHGSEILYTI